MIIKLCFLIEASLADQGIGEAVISILTIVGVDIASGSVAAGLNPHHEEDLTWQKWQQDRNGRCGRDVAGRFELWHFRSLAGQQR